MFRLLTILLALHFSTQGDAAPVAVVENGDLQTSGIEPTLKVRAIGTQDPKEEAKEKVRTVQSLLREPGADAYEDAGLAALIGDAIDGYNKAFGEKWTALEHLEDYYDEDEDEDEDETRITLMLGELCRIIEEMKNNK